MTLSSPFSAAFGHRFLVSVDTEEEFEWGKGFSRDGHSTTAVAALGQGQAYFAAADVQPLYFIDYPIAASDAAMAVVGRAIADGTAHAGAHLHPWVTPPFTEAVTTANSYAGNLPLDLERAKIRAVRDALTRAIGTAPVAYRAGRYGLGPNTLGLLADLGFTVDSSVRSLFDYRGDGGPNFSGAPVQPHWCGPDDTILELPLTSVIAGYARRMGPATFRRAGAVPFARALLARSGQLERIALTPEGTSAAKACDAIDLAVEDGIRLLSISFHSPSLAPGHTPYVRDAADLTRFYRWFDTVFEHCARAGIRPASLDDVVTDAFVHRRDAAAPPCVIRRASARAAS